MSDAARVTVPRMWHVTLTVVDAARAALEEGVVLRALELLVERRPYLLTVRYRADRAEIRYWEQAKFIGDATTAALRMWCEMREPIGLPGWEVVGLEAVDRETFHRRTAEGTVTRPVIEAGAVRPFEH